MPQYTTLCCWEWKNRTVMLRCIVLFPFVPEDRLKLFPAFLKGAVIWRWFLEKILFLTLVRVQNCEESKFSNKSGLLNNLTEKILLSSKILQTGAYKDEFTVINTWKLSSTLRCLVSLHSDRMCKCTILTKAKKGFWT